MGIFSRFGKNNNNDGFSENSEYIEGLLNDFLSRIEKKDYSNNHTLISFLDDVVNRKTQLYPRYKKLHWRYEMFRGVEDKRHYFVLKADKDNKVMVINLYTSLDDDILSVEASYRSDLSNYFSIGVFGTTVVRIDCSVNDNITYGDNVYYLDLLNGKQYTQDELDNKLVSSYQSSLIGKQRRK